MNRDEEWVLKEKYGGEKSAGFFTDCERLTAGEPLGFVIGFVPFLDCKIWLDSHPLIPRPETEYWVEHAIKTINVQNSAKILQSTEGSPREIPRATLGDTTGCKVLPRVALGRTLANQEIAYHSHKEAMSPDTEHIDRAQSEIKVLDLCAGSGAIGVAVAKAIADAHVTFSEIDDAHRPTIFKNLEENSIPCTRYQVFTSDLFSNISGRFTYILSNPPYIDPALNRTEPSVKDHEPHQALYGGDSGLELITSIIATSPKHLTPGGQLWLEHEPEQTKAIRRLGAAHGFKTTTHTDQYGVERYSILVLQ